MSSEFYFVAYRHRHPLSKVNIAGEMCRFRVELQQQICRYRLTIKDITVYPLESADLYFAKSSGSIFERVTSVLPTRLGLMWQYIRHPTLSSRCVSHQPFILPLIMKKPSGDHSRRYESGRCVGSPRSFPTPETDRCHLETNQARPRSLLLNILQSAGKI